MRLRLALSALLTFAGANAANAALVNNSGAPSPLKVAQEIKAGNLAEAHAQLIIIAAEKPTSATAFYLLSLDDAQLGYLGAARYALIHARSIDPKMSVADPRTLSLLDQALNDDPGVQSERAEIGTTSSNGQPVGLSVIMTAMTMTVMAMAISILGLARSFLV